MAHKHETIVVTRHPALVDLLRQRGIIDGSTPVLAHASEADVAGRRVVGVLPLRLAALAASVVEVPLDLQPEDRGKELGIDRIREIAGPTVEYIVRTISA